MSTAPRLVADLDERVYHADPALSSSGARTLLRSPARFAHERAHGRADTKSFDEGHAAHGLVLGIGKEIVVPTDPDGQPYAEWRTKDAKEQVEAARALGAVPLHPGQAATVNAMADQLRAHPVAGRLLAAGSGRPEVSGFWTDEGTGVACRFRADWLHWTGAGWLAVDYKTTDDASPEGFARSAAKWAYFQQDPWYRDGAAACGLGVVPFVFIAQEKTPPYLVGAYELDDEALTAGWARNRRALALFAECTRTGVWPGYSNDITRIGLPRWAVRDIATGEDYAA